MGASVSCEVATLFFAYQEIEHILPTFSKWTMLFLQHVDDGMMLWKVNSKEPISHIAFDQFMTEINV